MKFVTFSPNLKGDRRARLGVLLDEDRVIDAAAAGRSGAPHVRLGTLRGFMKVGKPAFEAVASLIGEYRNRDVAFIYNLRDVTVGAPLPNPRSLRVFDSFEGHARVRATDRDSDLSTRWFEGPSFSFSSHRQISGTDAAIPLPSADAQLDYELCIAAVIGTSGSDIPVTKAHEHIFGYMIMNDWTNRTEERLEWILHTGPAKSKDFATSFGPMLVTPDELTPHATDRTGAYNLSMTACVNGEEHTRASWADLHYDFAQMIERASSGVELRRGEVISSGAVGSLLAATNGKGPWLSAGDVVDLEIEGLGVLRNHIREST